MTPADFKAGQRVRHTGSGECGTLLCATDVMAVGAILECQRRGIAVPQQLAICGFDDLPNASSINPTLTTVSINRVEMGRAAGEVLLKRLDGRMPIHESVDVGFRIQERASTRRPVPRHDQSRTE
jgi:LacI family gluconate utilization system Gnt-I transcriptional repressor